MDNVIDQIIDVVMKQNNFSNDTKDKAECVIIDTMIAAIYGLTTETEVRNLIKDRGLEKGFSLPGEKYRLNYRDALISLGSAIVANELDEGNTLAKGHPSAHIFPAVYITSLENNSKMEEVIDAYIRGYEISVRLSELFQMKDNMHPHGTWGIAGGAAARAILLKKSSDEIKVIVRLALSLPLATSWLAAEKGQTVRNLYTGYGSVLAYDTVDLAAYGFKSSVEVVKDLWSNIMGTGIDESKVFGNIMNPPMITQNYFKIYPTCRFTHASIEAVKKSINDYDILYKNIEKIEIQTYNLAARCDTKNIKTRLESKFSIPYAVSCIAMNLNLFDNYEKNLAEIGNLINKVQVIDSGDVTALLPEKRAAKCIITANNKIFVSYVDNAQGELSNKFTEVQMSEKYMNMLKDFKGDSESLLNNIRNIDRTKTFENWLKQTELIRS